MKAILLKVILIASVTVGGLAAPLSAVAESGHDGHGDGEPAREEDAHGVRLVEDQLRRFGIRVEIVRPGEIDDGVELFGEIRPDGDHLAHIVPRFAGVVQRVLKSAGDRVQSGDVLAVIESDESLTPYQLKSQTSGTVVAKHITRGESVDRAKEAFVVADLGTVWADFAVFEKDLGRVGVGSKARVSSAIGGMSGEGVISYITPVVDGATRTATARVVLQNESGLWRPGMFVTARAVSGARAELTVFRSAVQKVEGDDVVFVSVDGEFRSQPVVLGRRGREVVEVLRGIQPGSSYAAGNTFILKAELGKGEAEHSH